MYRILCRDVEAVGAAVTRLSPGAVRVVAEIVGAPSEQEFVDSINYLRYANAGSSLLTDILDLF